MERVSRSQQERLLQFLTGFVIILLAIWSLISLVRVFSNTANPEYGGTDFYTYWYHGQYIRQGDDPYAAVFDGESLHFPLGHIDGHQTTAQEVDTQLEHLYSLPAYTPLLLLFFGLFSFFSWPVAKFIWLACNLAMIGLTPWLVCRFYKPARVTVKTITWVILALVFYGLLPTRLALGLGQPTIFVLFTLLMALLLVDSQRDVAGGIALGVALSKYTVALPVVLYLLYRKKYKAVVVSALVQALGIGLLAVLTGTSPLTIIESNLRLVSLFSEVSAFWTINISTLFPNGGWLPLLVVTLITLVTATSLFLLVRSPRRDSPEYIRLIDIHILSVLNMWGLLSVFHGHADAILTVFPLGLLLLVVYNRELWLSKDSQAIVLLVALVGIVGLLSMPGLAVSRFLPPGLAIAWGDVTRRLATVAIALLLALSIFLLFRLQNLNLHRS